MKNIAIFGAGGFGREVACLIDMINRETPTWNLIGFFDDNAKLKGTSNEYGKVLGGMSELNSWQGPLSVAIAIGNPTTVKRVAKKIDPRFDFPNLIAPGTVFLDKNNIKFGKGNIVCVGCFFSINVQVGDFNTFNNFISIGHDVRIGNYNSSARWQKSVLHYSTRRNSATMSIAPVPDVSMETIYGMISASKVLHRFLSTHRNKVLAQI